MSINQREALADSGYKAGKAQRHGDVASANFEHDWMRRTVRLDADPVAARQVWEDAYREGAANPYPVDPY